jgi:hypothetical protein
MKKNLRKFEESTFAYFFALEKVRRNYFVKVFALA